MQPSHRILWICALLIGLVNDRVRSAPVDWPQLALSPIVDGAHFTTHIAHAGDGSGRLFVVEQPGRIRIIQGDAFLSQPFLDISPKVLFDFIEDGLLSVAFPPGFASKGYFYVNYNRKGDTATVISRFFISSDPNVADPLSEQVILTIPQPYACHNAGLLAFGPDGFLYVATGDAHYPDDSPTLGQNHGSLLAKMLRIDVESTTTSYLVPNSNPFVGRPGYAPEIWALGLRNPWRYCFDRANGDLYIADVGQVNAEEIEFQPASSSGGINYGWPIREGKQNYRVPAGVDFSKLTDPVTEYAHLDYLNSITGGFVFRGPGSPRMTGIYFYADAYTGRISGLYRDGTNWRTEQVASAPDLFITTFGEDEAGRLYLADYGPYTGSGSIYRVEDSGLAGPPIFSPADGISYTDVIHIRSTSPGATIHYTLDGSEPNETDATVDAGGSVTVSNGTVLQARAFRSDLLPSAVTSNTFALRVAVPTFTPRRGPVSEGTPIAVSSITPGAILRYTLDGTEPGTKSTTYSTPIPFTQPFLFRVKGFKTGFIDSPSAVFETLGLILTANGLRTNRMVELHWPSHGNEVYQVQFSDDLLNWLDLDFPIAGTGSILSFKNGSLYPPPQHRAFRVNVQ
jgi:hypothetical protein